MKRRLFALASGATTLCGALGTSRAFGQTTHKPLHVALLAVSTEANDAIQLQAFRDGLRECTTTAPRSTFCSSRAGRCMRWKSNRAPPFSPDWLRSLDRWRRHASADAAAPALVHGGRGSFFVDGVHVLAWNKLGV
jgi:hypothetical protein